ncbi:hypothetical protein GCM10010358_33410 [Streptomyces minutiscleroticus]|uniref:Lipoprotein n=1 Tax=Streptomyces minutiscleroticus TaxID=68238 RepID=A0A918KWK4_9ACTN|nr:hypothetical protein GCM10010358_33410 [Streptomyces minutiscleroticus]
MRHRYRVVLGLCALVLLPVAAGCSSMDDTPSAAVPSPGAEAAGLCRNLDERLPDEVDGLGRNDPEPRSALTAAWGSPAIILRCGVPRPAGMLAKDTDSIEVNGVGWLMEEGDDGSFRFTTALRRAYVEVTLPKELASKGLGPLTDLAQPVKKAIPEGIAD